MNTFRKFQPVAVMIFILAAVVASGEGIKPQSADLETNSEKISIAPVATMRGQSAAETRIEREVISSGGDMGGTSTNLVLSGTVSQTAAGSGMSDNFGLNHGFWQSPEPGECDCRPGDANEDGDVNVGDAVYIIGYVFGSCPIPPCPPPMPYETCSGDANGDCVCNVGDAVYIIAYIFSGGAPPVTCEEWQSSCGAVIY
jgi:hypothetical protein